MQRKLGNPSLLLPMILMVACPRAPGAEPWPAKAREYRMHMIGQAHLDPVWLWPWPEGLSAAHSTFRSALQRMKETPDFQFTAACVLFYEWVAENDPAMMAEIRRRVAEGRWCPVGGWWVEADSNLPSGESLVRQGLYGQLTYRRLLGRFARSAYNPDSFGHPVTLPQILRLQGMEDFAFMRPLPPDKTLPGRVFWWEGADGTKLLTYRIDHYAYSGSVIPRLQELIGAGTVPQTLMSFYGAGDHGGGATRENIRTIAEVQADPGAPTVLYSTPERYFEEIRKETHRVLPLVKGDLQHFGVGCYTSVSEIKKNNRKVEAALVTAEKLASIGSAVWGATYPKEDFTKAWKKVLALQFHDSIAGVSLPEHYVTTARHAHGYALDVAETALYMAAQGLAWQVPAEGDWRKDYLVVVNPHAWDVTANIECNLKAGPGGALEDAEGKAVPFQWTRATVEAQERRRLVARVAVPALGYRQIRLDRDAAAETPKATVQARGNVLENEHLRVTIDTAGTIAVFDKDGGSELFRAGAGGARAVIAEDLTDSWGRDVKAFDKELGMFDRAQTAVLEDGPLRGVIRVKSTFGASTLTTDWLLYAGARALEARVTLDWREKQKMLKWSFPVDVGEPRATYEVPYGHIVREPNGDEEPGQRWIDVTGKRDDGEYGLAIINDAKYGYSIKDGDMRISVTRGAVYAHQQKTKLDPAIDYHWQDQGVQTFRMLLVPHQGGWQDAGIVRMAEEFVAPLPVILQGIHPGTRPQSDSFLSVDAPNVVVSAIKLAEEADKSAPSAAPDDLILRCYETAGRAADATIDLRFARKTWSGRFRPAEIKTLCMNRKTGDIREVNVLEE